MSDFADSRRLSRNEYLIMGAGFLVALFVGVLAVYRSSFAYAFLPVAFISLVLLLIFIFRDPFFGLLVTTCYSFLLGIAGREIGDFQFGLGIEFFLIITWLSVWYHSKKINFSVLNNDLVWLTLVWFVISCMQLANPAGASLRGWFEEIRTSALYPLVITPLGLLLINSKKRLNIFLKTIIILSLIACLNGIKQAKIGLWPGEQAFLNENPTHLIWGNLRVFSFYTDAGQFGASQAHFCVLAIGLFLAVKNISRKVMLAVLGVFFFYGMMISGTRGAFFVLVTGIFLILLMSKNLKILVVGGLLLVIGFAGLKYTNIGQGNYNIARLRSSVDTKDPSFNLRIMNQQKLRDYLDSRPLGGGLGSIGRLGVRYNSDKFLSTVAPDSYWVKVWAMYGIIGLIIFFCIWCYWIGKCIGMVWKLKDSILKAELASLLAGVLGIFIASYGNEVMNVMPSLLVIHLSLGAIYLFCYKSRFNINS